MRLGASRPANENTDSHVPSWSVPLGVKGLPLMLMLWLCLHESDVTEGSPSIAIKLQGRQTFKHVDYR